MDQGKIRISAYEQKKADLLAATSGDARIVASSALAIFDNFILPLGYTGGCYLVAMTLHRYLELEHGIETIPVVGYVNDGTDDVMISHAWLDFGGLKTDITLNLVDSAEPGALLVLDKKIRPGSRDYSYHLERTTAGIIQARMLLDYPDPSVSFIARHKEEEHRAMLARSKSKSLMDAYFAAVPPELSYSAITSSIR